MQHKYASDSHSHTSFSPDGSSSPLEMLQRANEIGLHYYTVTDHCECNQYTGIEESSASFKDMPAFDFRENTLDSLKELNMLQESFEGETQLLKGVELGQVMQNLEAAEEVVARNYDFILASLHNVGGFEDFYWLDYESMEEGYIDSIISKYFAELLETVKWGKFDSLSHLTYPVRYIRTPDRVVYNISSHIEEIEAVLEAVIKSQKAIELNTSGFFYDIKEPQPNQEILNLYHKMGGTHVTIGSDSHQAAHLGRGIDDGLDMLKAAGFNEFTVYINREPRLLPIE